MTWRNEVAKDAEAVLRDFTNGVPPTVYHQVALEISDCIPSPDGERNGLTEKMEIARLQEQLSHGSAAIEELTKEREEYRMRWLGSMTTEEAALIRAENARLRALVMLGDFSSLRPNSESFKLVQQIRREQSRREQSETPEQEAKRIEIERASNRAWSEGEL